jgi:hypothetical protein
LRSDSKNFIKMFKSEKLIYHTPTLIHRINTPTEFLESVTPTEVVECVIATNQIKYVHIGIVKHTQDTPHLLGY